MSDMDLRRAFDWMLRVAVNDTPHPTSYCRVYVKDGECNCGIWDAIRTIDGSRVGRVLAEYRATGKLPR